MKNTIDFVKRYHSQPKGAQVSLALLLSEMMTDENRKTEAVKNITGNVFKSFEDMEKKHNEVMLNIYQNAAENYFKNIAPPKQEFLHDAWGFVQVYYPNYDKADEIALADDLNKLVEDEYEIEDSADDLLHDKYDGDIKNPRILIDWVAVNKDIFERSIKEFIEGRSNFETR